MEGKRRMGDNVCLDDRDEGGRGGTGGGGGQVTHPVDSPTKQQNFFLPLPQQEQNTFLLFSY